MCKTHETIVALFLDFYFEHPDVRAFTKQQVSDFRAENNNIVVENFDKESKAPFMNPVMAFEHAFSKFPDVMATINKQGFSK